MFFFSIAQTTYAKPHENEVVLFGTSWCGYCKKTRAIFHRYGIEFTDYDIETSDEGRRKYDALSTPGIPIVLVGSTQINGYKPSAIEKALRAHGLINKNQ